ncbi:MAG: hypothetical protein ABUS56_12255, partial [Acidobacteriota bacterium]
MTVRRVAVAVLLVGALAGPVHASSVKVDALIGLARTEREGGNMAAAVAAFRDADRLEPLSGPTLVEFFWAASAAGDRTAPALGRRVIEHEPGLAPVRDRLIQLAIDAQDEVEVLRLCDDGIRLAPDAALWNRRAGEHALRVGAPADAAAAFARAAKAKGATPADRAQLALALEASGAIADADRAWADVSEALWQSRPEWTASRFRALVGAATPTAAAVALGEYLAAHPDNDVVRGLLVERLAAAGLPARALTAIGPLLAGAERPQWLRREAALAEQVGARTRAARALEDLEATGAATSIDRWQRARLLADLGEQAAVTIELAALKPPSCSTDLLDVADRLLDPSLLIDTVRRRAPGCPKQADWQARAVARAVAASRHQDAVDLLTEVVASGRATLEQRGLYGQLLLWTSRPAAAVPILEAVLDAAPASAAASSALVDAYRALGRPDDAWRLARKPCLLATEIPRRIACAEMALAVGEPDSAWRLTDFDVAAGEDRSLRDGIRGRVSLLLGRTAEATALLAPVVAATRRSEDVLALMDALRATDGPDAALAAAEQWGGTGA